MEQNNSKVVLGILVVVSMVLSIAAFFKGSPAPSAPVGATSRAAGTVSDYTSLYNNFAGSIDVDGASVLTGTTSPVQLLSPVGGTITLVATGTPITVYTNSTGPKLCDGAAGGLYVKNNGSFSPSLVWSLGTSTGTGASTNLIASSTVASSSSSVIQTSDRGFILGQGESLTAIFGDITNTEASTTYYSRLSAEARLWCSEISI